MCSGAGLKATNDGLRCNAAFGGPEGGPNRTAGRSPVRDWVAERATPEGDISIASIASRLLVSRSAKGRRKGAYVPLGSLMPRFMWSDSLLCARAPWHPAGWVAAAAGGCAALASLVAGSCRGEPRPLPGSFARAYRHLARSARPRLAAKSGGRWRSRQGSVHDALGRPAGPGLCAPGFWGCGRAPVHVRRSWPEGN